MATAQDAIEKTAVMVASAVATFAMAVAAPTKADAILATDLVTITTAIIRTSKRLTS